MGYEKELQYLSLSEAFDHGNSPDAGQLALPLIPDTLIPFSNQKEVRQTKPLTERRRSHLPCSVPTTYDDW